MEWQQIIGFYHVARAGSFTKAATATLRTQSALSQQVKALEQELGCLLFERIGRRKLRLTVAGERMLEFAQAVLESHELLLARLGELRGVPRGRLRIAAPFTTLYHLLPGLLQDYTGKFPEVELSVLDRSQQRVLALVRDGDVDFGLVLESRVPNDLIQLRWQEVKTMIITPPDHPLASCEQVTLKEIARYPLILPPRELESPVRSRLERCFQQEGVDYRIIVESGNVELNARYVEMGLGISFASVVPGVTAQSKHRLAFVPLDHCFERDYIALVMRKNKTLTPAKKAFVDMLFGASDMAVRECS